MPRPVRKRQPFGYIGVDPGKSGGIALLDFNSVKTWVMPSTRLDTWKVFEELGRRYVAEGDCAACIEWIHPAIQGIGKSPMSKLYGNYQMLWAFLVAADISREEVKPYLWLRTLGISPRKKTQNRTQWKDALREHAQGLYPNLALWGRTLGEQRAVCDALLIATYCKRLHEGGQQ